MSKESILLAKVSALKKNFDALQYGRGRCFGQSVEPLFPRYTSIIQQLKELNGELYGDIPELEIPKSMGSDSDGTLYEKRKIDPLVHSLEYIIELNTNVRIGDKIEDKEKKQRVFISHGGSKEWYKIQVYLERDLKIATLELAQEPNIGRTILQKLNEEAAKCSVAVIVMTGEDITKGDEIRARENVMHEIGFFQGRYGLGNVVLLHEVGVTIPSNIQGLVYISFPKDTVETAQGALTREMRTLFI